MSEAIRCDRCKQFSDSAERASINFFEGPWNSQTYSDKKYWDLCGACRLLLMDWVDVDDGQVEE